jgi:hypothetical protein
MMNVDGNSVNIRYRHFERLTLHETVQHQYSFLTYLPVAALPKYLILLEYLTIDFYSCLS